jgi:hypothetical protein
VSDEPSLSSPPIVSYASPSASPVRTAPAMFRLFGTSTLFCVCEWLTEYGCQQVYLHHKMRAAASSHAAMKAWDDLLYNMVIETVIALVAAIILLAGQAWAYPWRQARVRAVWPMTFVLGAMVSLISWGMWFYGAADGTTEPVRLGCSLPFGLLASWARRVR